MPFYRYCRPADSIIDSKGPLSRTIVPSVLAELNKEVKLVAAGQKKLPDKICMNRITLEEKVRVAQCGSINGV